MASPFVAWQNYYGILGAASATLTGLVFVVITLIAGRRYGRSVEAVGTFNTPTLVHFCATLYIAALMTVPWPYLWLASVALGLAGLAGVVYFILVARRLRRLSNDPTYRPVLEDWVGYALAPLVAHTLLLVAAILLPRVATLASFGIGASALLLLFIGIHNAWDLVTYLVLNLSMQPSDAGAGDASDAEAGGA